MVIRPTSAATEIRVRILGFARVREIMGGSEVERTCDAGSTAGDLWAALVSEMPELTVFSTSIRFARNANIVDAACTLADGDEVALLPPVSGG